MFARAMVLDRRGGAAVPVDLVDSSAVPSVTPTPASTTTHVVSKPEIGGSEAGFIGLVIGLGAIFLLSCIAVFFLLRNWQHGGRTVTRTVAGPSYPSSSPSGGVGGGGFRDKVRKFTKSGEVGVESGPDSVRRGGTLFGFRRNQRAGWVRAPGDDLDGDADEWDPRDLVEDLPYDAPPVPLATRNVGSTSPDAPLAKPTHFRDPFEQIKSQHQRSDSLESSETVVSPSAALPGGTKFKEDL